MIEHTGCWREHAAALGIPLDQIRDLEESVTIAEEAQRNAEALASAAKAAYLEAQSRRALAQRRTAAVIGRISATAANTPSPETVYALANIAPPAPTRALARGTQPTTNGPADAPLLGTPDRVAHTLTSSGSLTLRWECRNRVRGPVMYEVRRQITLPTADDPARTVSTGFELIATAGSRSFTDTAVPRHAVAVAYEIVPRCGRRFGPTSRHTVALGTAPLPASALVALKAA
jgi:hypothetical protein